MPANIHKNRIGLLVQEKLHLSKVQDKPTELKHLTERFQDVSTHLSHLLELLKDQQTRMKKYNESRVKVARHLAMMSVETPIHDLVAKDEGGKSFKALHNELKANSNKAEEQFAEETVKKVAEWKHNVSHRVHAMQQYCKGLRRDLVHYEKKVDKLRSSVDNNEQHGKEVNTTKYEKRDRNNEKLAMARDEYQKNTRELEMYLAQVTENGWRDLVPVVHRLATWDMTLAEDQASVLARLENVLAGLEDVAATSGFKASQDRIEELKHENVEVLVEPENKAVEGVMPSTPAPTEKPTGSSTPETVAPTPESVTAKAEHQAPASPKSTRGTHDDPAGVDMTSPPTSPERTTPEDPPNVKKMTSDVDADVARAEV